VIIEGEGRTSRKVNLKDQIEKRVMGKEK